MKDILKKKTKELFDKAKKIDIKEKAKQVGAIVTGGVLTSLAMGSQPKLQEVNKKIDVINKAEIVAKSDYHKAQETNISAKDKIKKFEKKDSFDTRLQSAYKKELENNIGTNSQYYDGLISKYELTLNSMKNCIGNSFGQFNQGQIDEYQRHVDKLKGEKATNNSDYVSRLNNYSTASAEDIQKFFDTDDNSKNRFKAIADEKLAKDMDEFRSIMEESKKAGDNDIAANHEFNQKMQSIDDQKNQLKPEKNSAESTNNIAYVVGGVAGSFAFKKKKKPGEE
jgi:phage shock protein A